MISEDENSMCSSHIYTPRFWVSNNEARWDIMVCFHWERINFVDDVDNQFFVRGIQHILVLVASNIDRFTDYL
mgnify:CR=1 FL=1